jgi:hypothetical protein
MWAINLGEALASECDIQQSDTDLFILVFQVGGRLFIFYRFCAPSAIAVSGLVLCA